MEKVRRKGMSRRALLKWLAVGSGSMLLAACAPVATSGQPGAQPNQNSSGGAGAAQSNLNVLVCCYTAPEVTLREQYNKNFLEVSSGAKLNMELLPAGQNYFEKLQTLIAAGTPPDVFDMWEGYIQPYAANGALLNMDPLFERDDKVHKDDLLPAALEAASWEGHVYSFVIGFMPGPISLYYNPKHFETASVDAPSPDWKWDDLRAAAKKLTVDNNKDGTPETWGLSFDLWFVPWLYWIWSNGGDVFNKDQTQCTLQDAKAVEALQYWADVVNVDKTAVSPAALKQMQGGLNAFQTGAVSMYLGNTWDVATLKEAKDFTWKAVISPKANDGNRIWYEHLWCWALSAQTKQVDLGWKFIRDFVLNRVIDPATPTIPPLKQLLDKFNTQTNKDLGYTPLISLATEPNKFRIPGSGAKWDKISGLIQAELDLVFIGEKKAADAAATVTPQVNQELARS
jgi:multiple sugar transport system substrate-binding protein